MSLSGARPTVTIWLGSATIRPANGPDSKVSSAAKPAPAVICSIGTAWSEIVRFESGGSLGWRHAGMIDVASSNVSVLVDLFPFPGAVPPGHRIMVDLTESTGAG